MFPLFFKLRSPFQYIRIPTLLITLHILTKIGSTRVHLIRGKKYNLSFGCWNTGFNSAQHIETGEKS